MVLGPHVPDLAALQMLVAVSELGSLSQVAKELGVSQQAVSSRMRSLESQVGSVLVTRTSRGSQLTASGAMVAEWAADVLQAAGALEAGIESLRSTTRERLDVAASLTVAEHLLPAWLVALRQRQLSAGQIATKVALTATNSERVITLVRAGEVTIGFIETPNIPKDLRTAVVGHDTLRVAAAPGHAWARRHTPLTAAELARTPLITREPGSGTRQALEELLAGLDGIDTVAAPHAELSSNASVRTAIASGAAPGVLSSLAIADDVALGRLVVVEVADAVLTRTLCAVWRTGRQPPQGPAQDLVAIARGSHRHDR